MQPRKLIEIVADSPLLYTLDDDNQPVQAESIMKWSAWMTAATDSGRRVVARSEPDSLLIITVFTGISRNRYPGPPLGMFETTMTHPSLKWLGKLQGPWRYDTWKEATVQHALLLRRLGAR